MGEIERPDPNVLFVWRAEILTSWGIMCAIALGLGFLFIKVDDAPTWVLAFASVPVGFAVLALFLLKLRWQRWTFQLTPFTLEMSHGWWIQRRRVVSLSRIQHVDFQSGPIGRRFDLVHVVVHTAGATVGTIPGIKSERAERLRAELMAGPKLL
jgi:membrane protein YdbS with pleckstrin-like domain